MKIKYLKFSLVFIVSGFWVLGMQTQPAAQQIDNSGQQQNQEKIQSLRTHSFHLRELNDQYKGLKIQKHLDSMIQEANDRADLLEELVKKDPQKALDSRLTSAEIQGYPQEVRNELEQDIDVEGQLEVVIEDDFENKTSQTHYSLIQDDGQRYSLHSTDHYPESLSGSRIRVKGMRVKQRIAVPSAEGGIVK